MPTKVNHTAELADVTERHYWLSLDDSSNLEVPVPKKSTNQTENVERQLQTLSVGDRFRVTLSSRTDENMAWYVDTVSYIQD